MDNQCLCFIISLLTYTLHVCNLIIKNSTYIKLVRFVKYYKEFHCKKLFSGPLTQGYATWLRHNAFKICF